MRYDWQAKIGAEPGTAAYFNEIDKRAFQSVFHYLPWQQRPFEQLIDFSDLSKKDVLEIGVGHGSHSQLIAPHCKSYTGVDLTETAVCMTKKRLELAGIKGMIFCMDAERMTFPDKSFDLIWSWGVIHHSSNTLNVLKKMQRVLRPGGSAIVMVYHRSLWTYYILGLLKGIFLGDFWRYGNVHKINQAGTDGAIARFYNRKEWEDLCKDIFAVNKVMIMGQKSDVIPIPAGNLKRWIEDNVPDNITRLLTNRLGMGLFLVSKMTPI